MRARFLPMLLTGLILAIIFLAAVQITQSVRNQFNSEDNLSSENANRPAPVESIKPIVIRSVSEENGQLFISGEAHPEVVISVQSFGEEIKTDSADQDGLWEIVLEVSDSSTLMLEFVESLEGSLPVRSDEVIHRIPAPALDEASVDQSPRPLIMSAAPGGPSSIFQSPFRGLPTQGAISMGSIDYDESGGVIFSGVSGKDGRVRVYANDVAIGEVRVQANGRWYIIAADTLPRGSFEIRATLITAEGIDSEVKVPFERLTLRDGDPGKPLEIFFDPYTWQIRRTLIGGGYQYT
ncbi:MAG: hypothetical protein HKN36_10190, partial [Hellea sp.]|nr:hypothetical protein [Hellea sp.]